MAQRSAILVIDGDPALRSIAHDVQAKEGYRVVAASTHEDGLTALSAVRFALILCDTGAASEGNPADRWGAPGRIKTAAGKTPSSSSRRMTHTSSPASTSAASRA